MASIFLNNFVKTSNNIVLPVNQNNIIIGDGIAEGYGVARGYLFDSSNKYRNKIGVLANVLENYTGQFWINNGLNGNKIQDIINRWNDNVFNDSFDQNHSGNIILDRTLDLTASVYGVGSNRKTIPGTIVQADNEDLIIAVSTDDSPAQIKIIKSSDLGSTWAVIKTISDVTYDCFLNGSFNFNGILYISVLKQTYTATSEYRGFIYKSTDNGATWNLVYSNNLYALTFSEGVYDGTKMACALWQVPYPGGYTQSIVDFGWYDTSNDTLQVVSRLAVNGESGRSFPSECFFYRRDFDNNLVAGVRWGEAPAVPYTRLKLSIDNGVTWTDLGPTWAGHAGLINIARKKDNTLWASGYYEPNGALDYSAIWQIVPNSGSIVREYYPFGQVLPVGGRTGNGKIICGKDDYLYFVLGNGTMFFGKLKIENTSTNMPILIVNVGIQDVLVGTSESNIKALFTTLFSLCPSKTAIMSVPYSSSYVSLITDLNSWLSTQCTAKGFAFIDYYSYSQTNQGTNKYADTLNPTILGYNDIVQNIIKPALQAKGWI